MSETELKVRQIAEHIKEIINILGEDCSRQGLVKTPERAAKVLVKAFSGYDVEPEAVVGDALFDAPGEDMIVVRDIEFYSLCEHHILPFFGHVSIGYIPNGKIVGLSKLARLVNVYARRLQVQERFQQELANAICRTVGTHDVIIRCSAQHLCMKMRGVEKQDAVTVTTAKRGRFAVEQTLVNEFFELIS